MGAREEGPGGFAAGYEEIEHSGDVGIEAWGATRAELVANATRGLLALMAWSRVAPEVTRRIEVVGVGPADVLVDWLSAVILSAAAHGEVYGEVEVERADEASAAGVVRGARFDPQRHELRFDVKAATYHRLVCEEMAGGFHARVIFDL